MTTKKENGCLHMHVRLYTKYWLFGGYLLSWLDYCHFKPKQKLLTSKLFKILTKVTINNNKEGKRLFAHARETVKNIDMLWVICFSDPITIILNPNRNLWHQNWSKYQLKPYLNNYIFSYKNNQGKMVTTLKRLWLKNN